MAVLTAQGISSVAVELLTRSLMLPGTVTPIPGGEFAGDNGDTITVRVRQPRSANTQSSPGDSVDYSDIDETSVNVTLTHMYDATRLTDEDLSLNIVDFASQVTEPQVAAVATRAEDELAGVMNDMSADEFFEAEASSDDTDERILAAREALSENDVPASNRWLAVAPDIMTRLLSVDKFVRADASGDTSALRQATMGRIYGMTVVESNGLESGTAIAYHRSGFVFANRVPIAPRGLRGDQVGTARSAGIGMRQVFDFDTNNLRDRSVLSTFAGAEVVDSDRVYKLDTSTT